MSWLMNNSIGDRWNDTVRHYAELYDKEIFKGSLTKDNLFEISSVLVRSDCSQYIKLAIDILEHLTTSVDSKVVHRSYLIYLTIGYLRLKELVLAHNCLKQLKIIDPNSRHGTELECCLQKLKPKPKVKPELFARRRYPNGESPLDNNDDDDQIDSELTRILSSTLDPNKTL